MFVWTLKDVLGIGWLALLFLVLVIVPLVILAFCWVRGKFQSMYQSWLKPRQRER